MRSGGQNISEAGGALQSGDVGGAAYNYLEAAGDAAYAGLDVVGGGAAGKAVPRGARNALADKAYDLTPNVSGRIDNAITDPTNALGELMASDRTTAIRDQLANTLELNINDVVRPQAVAALERVLMNETGLGRGEVQRRLQSAVRAMDPSDPGGFALPRLIEAEFAQGMPGGLPGIRNQIGELSTSDAGRKPILGRDRAGGNTIIPAEFAKDSQRDYDRAQSAIEKSFGGPPSETGNAVQNMSSHRKDLKQQMSEQGRIAYGNAYALDEQIGAQRVKERQFSDMTGSDAVSGVPARSIGDLDARKIQSVEGRDLAAALSDREVKEPMRLVNAIRQFGGLRDTDDIRGLVQGTLDNPRKFAFVLNNKSGRHWDDMAEKLTEQGYFETRPTVQEFFAALDDDVRDIQPRYRSQDSAQVEAFNDYRRRMNDAEQAAYEASATPQRGQPAGMWTEDEPITFPSVPNDKIQSLIDRMPPQAFKEAADYAREEGLPNTEQALGFTRRADLLKRGLDDLIEQNRAKGKMTRVRSLTILKNEFLKEVDAYNPAFAKARQEHGDLAKGEKALAFGDDFVRSATASTGKGREALENLIEDYESFSEIQKQAANIALRDALSGAITTKKGGQTISLGKLENDALLDALDRVGAGDISKELRAIFKQREFRGDLQMRRQGSPTADKFQGREGARRQRAGPLANVLSGTGTAAGADVGLMALGGPPVVTGTRIGANILSNALSPGKATQSDLARLLSAPARNNSLLPQSTLNPLGPSVQQNVLAQTR